MKQNYLSQYLELEKEIDMVIRKQMNELVNLNSSVNATFASSVVIISFVQILIGIINGFRFFPNTNEGEFFNLPYLYLIVFMLLFILPYGIKPKRNIYVYGFIILRVFVWQPVILGIFTRLLYSGIKINLIQALMEPILYTLLVFFLIFGAMIAIHTFMPWNILILLDHNLINPNKGGVLRVVNLTLDSTKAIDELLIINKHRKYNWDKLLKIANLRDIAKESQIQSLTLFITAFTLLGLISLLNQSKIQEVINQIFSSGNIITLNVEVISILVILLLVIITILILIYTIYYMQKSIYMTKIIQLARLFLTIKQE